MLLTRRQAQTGSVWDVRWTDRNGKRCRWVRPPGIMDAVTKVVIETICDAGMSVTVRSDGTGASVVEAVNLKTGERFVVRAAKLYDAAVELAVQVGIDLED